MKKVLLSMIILHLSTVFAFAQEQSTLAQESSTGVSFGSILIAALSISLFLVIGYLLIKLFKL
ncbi:MAG: hypothetical protein PHE21_01485 [Candidatus Dojkabacteria bacterium]|nr:hypothetical protein [Candidatus Dojkabacteria bacterium]